MQKSKSSIFAILFFLVTANFAIGQTEHQSDLSPSPQRFVLRFHGAPLMTKLNSDIYSGEAKSQFGYSFGTDLSYYFFNNGKFRSSVSLGLGLSKYNSKYNLSYSDSIWTTDADNQPVFIKEDLKGYVENQGVLFLDIPAKLWLEYALSPRLDAYLNLGFAYGLALQNSYDNAGTLTRSGYYPDLNALLYDIDVEGSPYFYPSNKAMAGSGEFNVQNNISFETGVGLQYKLNQQWSVSGGVKYMQGLKSIKQGDGMMNQVSASNYEFKSIMNRNDVITTQAFGLEIGLSFNLGRSKKTSRKIEEPLGIEYLPHKDTISLPEIQPIIMEEPALDTTHVVEVPPAQLDVNISVLDSKTGQPINATIELTVDGQIIQTIDFNNKALSQIKIEENKDYAVTINSEGYLYQYDKLDFAALSANSNLAFKLDPIVNKETNIELRPITFQTGSENLNDESNETINMILNMLKENPDKQIEIAGHADSIGNVHSNQRLSLRRAQTIVDHLVANGANADQLKAVGYGSERPIADNSTEEGRSKNRRVEFKVLTN